jgi:hypothetical protein
MTTFADRATVLTAVPTTPGDVVGRCFPGFGAPLWDASVLGPELNPQTDAVESYAWSRSGVGSEATSQARMQENLAFFDWHYVGRIPAPDEIRDEDVLTELPTKAGSVIGHSMLINGEVFFQAAVLSAHFDVETDQHDGWSWKLTGEDSFPEVEVSELWLVEDRWVFIGVIPQGDASLTKAQRAARKAADEAYRIEQARPRSKSERAAEDAAFDAWQESLTEREAQRERLGVFTSFWAYYEERFPSEPYEPYIDEDDDEVDED